MGCELLHHDPFNSDLASSHFHDAGPLSKEIGGQKFEYEEQVKQYSSKNSELISD
jgi:hypothetical protein